jgi:ligand-binding sensor domain-containing protein
MVFSGSSPSGLFRFDGTRFERFHAPSGDQLLSTNVNAMFAPPTGGLWVGYEFGGFSFVNNGRVTNYGGEVAASTGSVDDFAQDHDGIMSAGTTNGVWRFEKSIWRHLGTEWSAPVGYRTKLATDRTGILWILMESTASSHTLLYLLPGSRRFRVADENVNAFGFTLDADHKVVTILWRIWVAAG